MVQRQAGNPSREPTGKHGIQEALCDKRHKEALKDEFMEQSLFLEWSGGRLSLRSSGGDSSEMAKEAERCWSPGALPSNSWGFHPAV